MKKPLFNIVMRYIILLAIALIVSFSSLFYDIFLLLTIYPLNWLLNLSYMSFVYNSSILVESANISIIPACVGVSAYLLLLILNLSVAMSLKKRVFSILFSFSCLLLANILRIYLLILLLLNGSSYFDALHMLLWYFTSIVLVVGIWFLTAYIFKIRAIPIYTDFQFILKGMKTKHTKK